MNERVSSNFTLGEMTISVSSFKIDKYVLDSSQILIESKNARKITEIKQKVFNSLIEAHIHSAGIIDDLKKEGKNKIVKSTYQTYLSLKELGHTQPMKYISNVTATPITSIHFRVDVGKIRAKQ